MSQKNRDILIMYLIFFIDDKNMNVYTSTLNIFQSLPSTLYQTITYIPLKNDFANLNNTKLLKFIFNIYS